MMPNQFSTPASATDQELLAAYRNALLSVSQNQESTVAGRTFRKANLPELRATIDWLEARIADANPAGDGTGYVLARFHGR